MGLDGDQPGARFYERSGEGAEASTDVDDGSIRLDPRLMSQSLAHRGSSWCHPHPGGVRVRLMLDPVAPVPA